MNLNDRLLYNIGIVTAILGMGKSTVYAKLDRHSPYYDASFPRPIRLSPSGKGAVAWVAAEIHEWINNQVAKRDAQIRR